MDQLDWVIVIIVVCIKLTYGLNFKTYVLIMEFMYEWYKTNINCLKSVW